jgi:ArsR family transcriptional regulator, arsenate/arsenite/antimonite-responsive transcriptional repressor
MLWRAEADTMTTRKPPAIPQPQAQECCAPIGVERLPADDAAQLSRQFAALADPVRLRILSVLATAPGGAICACDLVEPVGKSQPTVSHHLKVLKTAGLVTAQRDGKNIWYAVVPAALDALREVLSVPAR